MEPLKLGIVGVGGMGGSHARMAQHLDEVEVVAVADVNAETAQKVGEEIGAQSFSDATEMMGAPGLEAVLIVTPHIFHPPVAREAASRGLHVLSEKPLAVSVSEADGMIEACREGSVLLGVMFQQRTDASRLKMKELVEAGVVGELHRVSMSAPWYRPQAYYDSGSWRGTWEGEGGGILMNQAPHSLDQFLWIGGSPLSVQAIATTREHDVEIENTCVGICDYGSGKVGWFYSSTATVPGQEVLEVSGDKGTLSWENGKLRFYELEQPISSHLRDAQEKFANIKGQWHDIEFEPSGASHARVLQAFTRAVREGDASLMIASGEDGLRSLELANAFLLAGFTRRETPLPLDRAAYDELFQSLKDGVAPDELREAVV